MVKLIALFKRKAGISVEQFQGHWRTTHAELVVRQRGLRRYVQNHTLASAYHSGKPATGKPATGEPVSREPDSREPVSREPDSREPDYDGVAEAWFDDTQAMRELGASAEYRAVRADEANFIDAASMQVVITDEIVIV
ncbi:MAG: EthD domain-containing protein, partial [Myxococcota bacterium]